MSKSFFEKYLLEGDMGDLGELPKESVDEPQSGNFSEDDGLDDDLESLKKEISMDLASAIVDAMASLDDGGAPSDLDNVDGILAGDDPKEEPVEPVADQGDDTFGDAAEDPDMVADADADDAADAGGDDDSQMTDRISQLEQEVATLKAQLAKNESQEDPDMDADDADIYEDDEVLFGDEPDMPIDEDEPEMGGDGLADELDKESPEASFGDSDVAMGGDGLGDESDSHEPDQEFGNSDIEKGGDGLGDELDSTSPEPFYEAHLVDGVPDFPYDEDEHGYMG